MLMAAGQRLDLAYNALKQYAIKPVLVKFLQHSENLTFEVETRQGTYLLRLHSPRSESFGRAGENSQMVNSEMLWLEALRQLELPVPTPIKNTAGEFVSVTGSINATLLAWQEGELLTRDMESEATAAQIGSLVGQLHAHASQWNFPPGFARPALEAVYFEKALHSLWPAVQDGRITERDFQSLSNAMESLLAETTRLASHRQIWGLLHGDLHRGNFLLHEGQIRLIDFSMCAFGHFAFDLGTCLSNIRVAFHPAFIDHYTQLFPLPPGSERLVEGYFLASYIATFALWISDPRSQEVLIQRVAYIAREYATRFNRDERFWFR